ncbi:MAG: hypothetical protein KDJ36_07395 [Hyphomicrobiaceae bacterium]|nr:hypothetical protein [Hyphomicrobiaceae bacterium]
MTRAFLTATTVLVACTISMAAANAQPTPSQLRSTLTQADETATPLIEVGMRSKRRRSFGRAKHRRRRSLSGSRGGRKSPSILVPGYVYLQWKACNPGPDGIFLSPNCK